MDAGFTRRIILPHDYSAPKARRGGAGATPSRQPRRLQLHTGHALPRLKELGASNADIRQITVENPKRFFAGEQAR